MGVRCGGFFGGCFSLALFLDVLPVGFLVGLNVLESAVFVPDGVKLLAR
jgi:hypothetical protein